MSIFYRISAFRLDTNLLFDAMRIRFRVTSMQVELTNLAFDDFLDATSLARKTHRFNPENELDEILEELMFVNIEE